MRVPIVVLVCLLVLLRPVAAEDEKKADPKQPAQAMTEEERTAAVKKAEGLTARLTTLYRQGKYREAIAPARTALALRAKALGPEHPDVATSLHNLASLLMRVGAHGEARPLYERALAIREKALAPGHTRVISSLEALAKLLQRQGAYGEALPLYKRVLELREEALGAEHTDVATSLNNLALLLHTQGEYEQARPLYERALRIREKVLDPEHAHTAVSLNNLAGLLHRLGAYTEARPLYERALRIREKALGPGHPRVATTLHNLAALHGTLGAYEEARPLYERSLKICEKAFGSEHPRVAAALHNLAGLHHTQGTYEDARPLFERALRIREKKLGPEHPDVAATLNSLAMLLGRLGAYEEARPLFERALQIREKALGPEHAKVADTLMNLVGLLVDLGAYELARPLGERALEIRTKALGREHPDVAHSLHGLGLLHRLLGANEEARLLYERALHIREKAFGPGHPQVAASLSNLALLLHIQGATAEARPLYERALAIQEETLGHEHPDLGTTLNDLALLLKKLEAYEEARPLYERALEIREKTFGAEHAHVAVILNNLAALLEALEAYDEAQALYERSLEIREATLGPGHPEVAWSLYSLALLHGAQGHYNRAAPLIARCLDIFEQHVRRNMAGLQAAERSALMRSLRVCLDYALEIAPHLGRSGHAEVLRFKGLLARVATAERKLARAEGADAAVRVTALHTAERRLAKLAGSMPSFRDKAKKAAWQEAYARAASDREKQALALARDFEPLRAGLGRLDLKRADLQAQVGKGALVLDFLRSGGQYLVWVVRHEGEPTRVDLGKADRIDAAAAAFAARAADAGDAGSVEAGQALRDLVFTPIEEHIDKDVRTIYVCPDAALAAVPLAALPGKTEGRLMTDDYRIQSISMAQDLVPWKDEPKPGKGALLLGGVDYGDAAETTQKGLSAARTFADRAPRGKKFVFLLGSQAEANTIGTQLGKGATVLLGKNATEAGLRAGVRGRRVLHLATHGFVRDDLMRGLVRRREAGEWLGASMERQLVAGHDPMLLAGLAMAGANTREGGNGDDGILTALEASHLDLDGVGLVVLSACQTALGKAESGDGVIGLVRGFQMAGAKQVIGSLWKVDDEATKALMSKMYELWAPKDGSKGLRAAVALRKAQTYVRSQEAWKHPYYWAAWVIWGIAD